MQITTNTTHTISFTEAEMREILQDYALKKLGLPATAKASIYIGPNSGWPDSPTHCKITITIP